MEPARPWGWAFIDLAVLGRNTFWSYVFTLLRVILLPIGVFGLAVAMLWAALAAHAMGPSAARMALVVALFGALIAAGVGLAWGVARSHRRPWLSLISPDLRLDWRRLAIGAAVEGVLLLGFIGAWKLIGRPLPLGSSMPLPTLTIVMLAIPFQAATEEMLFHGYLTQALGRVVRSRLLIATTVGVAFAGMHFGAYGPLTMPYMLVLSLTYSLVSLRDNRLELTIGAHTATNWLAIGATDILADAGRGIVHVGWGNLLAIAVNGAVFYVITRLLIRVFCERRVRQ